MHTCVRRSIYKSARRPEPVSSHLGSQFGRVRCDSAPHRHGVAGAACTVEFFQVRGHV